MQSDQPNSTELRPWGAREFAEKLHQARLALMSADKFLAVEYLRKFNPEIKELRGIIHEALR